MAGLSFDGKSTQSVGGISGSFNFSPQKGIDPKNLLIGVAVCAVLFIAFNAIKKKGGR